MARVVLTEQARFALPDGPGLWLDPVDILRVTGWKVKPEGMCRGEVCVPLPGAMRRDAAVDVAAFWRLLGAPVATEGNAWALGTAAEDRNAALGSLDAPDFALPDLEGRMHRLSDLRGKKVFLTTWASW